MFWDNVAIVYDIFVNIINRKTHEKLKLIIQEMINENDDILECACGTGMLSKVIEGKCHQLTATDYSLNMLRKAKKNCASLTNIKYEQSDITDLNYPDESFDKVVAGNVIHLLDEPLKALNELNRVCKNGGKLIIPTYMNRDDSENDSSFSKVVGKAGADFKRQLTLKSYEEFFKENGYTDVKIIMAEGRIPCAVAVMNKKN